MATELPQQNLPSSPSRAQRMRTRLQHFKDALSHAIIIKLSRLRQKIKDTCTREKLGEARKQSTMALIALGVVYGDIGTSPLYALKECFFSKTHGIQPTPENIFGILSLVAWSLFFVVTFKYLSKVMRAENQGEGGILALLALIVSGKDTSRLSNNLRYLALAGAALLFADGFITPVISIYGSMEGAADYDLIPKTWIPKLVIGILTGLFAVQSGGTARIGMLFGPIMLLWFICLGALGLPAILQNPTVLHAMNPYYAVKFLTHNPWHGFLSLGLVVLVITGGEALYADMGHFGRRTIARAWYGLVLPCLLLSYFGQGAWLLSHQTSITAATNPLFVLAPAWFQKPFAILAAAAAIIASQALISGAFSLYRQLAQQGFVPRPEIRHTSPDHEGQIYVPAINWGLYLGCIFLAYFFRVEGATGLATAYGIAVTGTMGITSILYGFFLVRCKNWTPQRALLLVTPIVIVDLAFFGANSVKFLDGGYLPIGAAAVFFLIMTTWYICRQALKEEFLSSTPSIEMFMEDEHFPRIHRVKGTAVAMTPIEGIIGNALMHNFKLNKTLHELVLCLTINTKRVPEIPHNKRLRVKEFGAGMYSLVADYGFMQSPSMSEILSCAQKQGVPVGTDISYLLSRETIFVKQGYKLPVSRWRVQLFAIINLFSISAARYFGIPNNRVAELGKYVDL